LPGAPAQLVHDVDPEVLDDHRHHLLDVDRVQLQKSHQRLGRLLARHLRVILDLLDQAEEALVGGVVGEHVEDEALDQILADARRGPLAELGAAGGAHAVADGEDHVEVG
jgi:hypothetical protein